MMLQSLSKNGKRIVCYVIKNQKESIQETQRRRGRLSENKKERDTPVICSRRINLVFCVSFFHTHSSSICFFALKRVAEVNIVVLEGFFCLKRRLIIVIT
jgi:hypothetical protein